MPTEAPDTTNLAFVPSGTEDRIPVLAIARNYPELRKAIAARRRQLGLSQLKFDELSGLTGSYVSKIEAGMRCFGDMSLATVLATLGLDRATRGSAYEANAARLRTEPLD